MNFIACFFIQKGKILMSVFFKLEYRFAFRSYEKSVIYWK